MIESISTASNEDIATEMNGSSNRSALGEEFHTRYPNNFTIRRRGLACSALFVCCFIAIVALLAVVYQNKDETSEVSDGKRSMYLRSTGNMTTSRKELNVSIMRQSDNYTNNSIFSTTLNSTGSTHNYTTTPLATGPTHGYTIAPSSLGSTHNYTIAPSPRGSTHNYTTTPSSKGSTHNYTTTPLATGPTHGYTIAPSSLGSTHNYTISPSPRGSTHNYTTTWLLPRVTHNYSTTPSTPGSTHNYTTAPPGPTHESTTTTIRATLSSRPTTQTFPKRIPKFIQGPSVIGPSMILGSDIYLIGCKLDQIPYSSKNITFWYLKNGYVLIHSTSRQEGYNFPILNLTKSRLKDGGYYQCMVRIAGFPDILSEVVDVRFEDVSATSLEIRFTEKDFHSNLLNRTSEEFKNLVVEVNDMVSRSLGNCEKCNTSIEVLRFRAGSVIADVFVQNLTGQPEKIRYCSKNALENFKKSIDCVECEVTAVSLDCCSEEEIGETEYKGKYIFNTTLLDDHTDQGCIYQTANSRGERECRGNFLIGPKWKLPVLSNCSAKWKTTNDLIGLSKVPVCNETRENHHENCSPPLEVSNNLTAIIVNYTVIRIKHDINFIERIITNIVTAINDGGKSNENTKITENILEVVDKILEVDEKLISRSQLSSPSTILQALDELALKLTTFHDKNSQKFNQTGFFANKNIALAFAIISPNSLQIRASGNSTHLSMSITGPKERKQQRNIEASGKVSRKIFSSFSTDERTFNQAHNSGVFSFFYRNSKLFQPYDNASSSLYGNATKTSFIGSNVLAATFTNVIGITPGKNIELKFKKTKIPNIDGEKTRKCSFWNPYINKWSQKGCWKVEESNDEITCQCNHLTNFGILVDISQTGYNPLSLRIFTWIGCGISVCGLLLTMTTYIVFRSSLLTKLPMKILLCLCSSLTALLITFLAGVERRSDLKLGCQISASLIHYFTLTTFCWMAVEGYSLYKSFVKIFPGRGSSKKTLIRASIFSWGFPALIVIITAAAAPDNLGKGNFCVTHGYSFYFGLLLPIALILLVNFVIIYFVLKSILTAKTTARQNVDSKFAPLRQAKIALTCTTLLGLTWVFALFAIGDARDLFQWLFTIFNSLQGLFIFIFYVLLNPNARKEWLQCFLPTKHSTNKLLSPQNGRNPVSPNKSQLSPLKTMNNYKEEPVRNVANISKTRELTLRNPVYDEVESDKSMETSEQEISDNCTEIDNLMTKKSDTMQGDVLIFRDESIDISGHIPCEIPLNKERKQNKSANLTRSSDLKEGINNACYELEQNDENLVETQSTPDHFQSGLEWSKFHEDISSQPSGLPNCYQRLGNTGQSLDHKSLLIDEIDKELNDIEILHQENDPSFRIENIVNISGPDNERNQKEESHSQNCYNVDAQTNLQESQSIQSSETSRLKNAEVEGQEKQVVCTKESPSNDEILAEKKEEISRITGNDKIMMENNVKTDQIGETKESKLLIRENYENIIHTMLSNSENVSNEHLREIGNTMDKQSNVPGENKELVNSKNLVENEFVYVDCFIKDGDIRFKHEQSRILSLPSIRRNKGQVVTVEKLDISEQAK